MSTQDQQQPSSDVALSPETIAILERLSALTDRLEHAVVGLEKAVDHEEPRGDDDAQPPV